MLKEKPLERDDFLWSEILWHVPKERVVGWLERHAQYPDESPWVAALEFQYKIGVAWSKDRPVVLKSRLSGEICVACPHTIPEYDEALERIGVDPRATGYAWGKVDELPASLKGHKVGYRRPVDFHLLEEFDERLPGRSRRTLRGNINYARRQGIVCAQRHDRPDGLSDLIALWAGRKYERNPELATQDRSRFIESNVTNYTHLFNVLAACPTGHFYGAWNLQGDLSAVTATITAGNSAKVVARMTRYEDHAQEAVDHFALVHLKLAGVERVFRGTNTPSELAQNNGSLRGLREYKRRFSPLHSIYVVDGQAPR